LAIDDSLFRVGVASFAEKVLGEHSRVFFFFSRANTDEHSRFVADFLRSQSQETQRIFVIWIGHNKIKPIANLEIK